MPENPKLLQLGKFTERMEATLSPHFEIQKLFNQDDRARFLAKHGAKVTALCTDGHWGIPDDVFEACPNLRIVSSYGVGYDGIDTDRAVDRGILVSHTPDVLTDEVATTALMLWLAVSRRLVPQDAWARSGQWEREGDAPLTRSVLNRRIGILGLGRIGQTIAEMARIFAPEVHYHARSQKDVRYSYHRDPVSLARAVEVLFVITPGGAGTRHLVDAAVIDALGSEGILINIARGSVVDERALVEALEVGRLGGAGLDVFEEEPKIPDALKPMENVVLVPHVGSATVETRQAMGDLVCDNLLQWLRDGTLKTPVPECRHLL